MDRMKRKTVQASGPLGIVHFRYEEFNPRLARPYGGWRQRQGAADPRRLMPKTATVSSISATG